MDKITSITYDKKRHDVYVTYEKQAMNIISCVDYFDYCKIVSRAQELSHCYEFLGIKYIENRFLLFCLSKGNHTKVKLKFV